MYIKSMVVDGFKSYAQRTEIHGFDPLFNAITGLNGSGKSNILDSICFLLGITNLSQVRATNLQELVYKNGQAGITKATVSITFDNLDKKQSPLGYEQFDEITITRQVVVGGRNKYLINGSNANNTRVQDLFRSVQLNVNNPHFLIMQGRITKVLNMKPPEILSMIEEAAGTRLYESKREAAQRTIEKKDAKLKEIDTVLKEDITPTITKLKEERSSYLEYQKINRELEHLHKLYIAYQFLCAEEKKKRSAEELLQMQESMEKLKSRITEIEQKVLELDGVIAELERKRDEESGSVMQKLETTLSENKKLEALAQSAVDNKKEGVKAENKLKKELSKNLTDNTVAIEARTKGLGRLDKDLERLQAQTEADQEAHTVAQNHYQAVTAGLSSNEDGQATTLADQLITAKNEISNAETEAKQAAMKLKHAQQDLKKKEADMKKTEQGYAKDKKTYEAVQQNLNKIEAEMKKLGYEEGKEERLDAERRTLTQACSKLQEKLETLEARYPNLQFEYRDPEKNFDRRKVNGLVCKLIKVNDVKAATALEVTAGGKLYNVVVDTEKTGKQLMQKGELRRRYTIIPLNKISSRPITADVAKRAQGLVGPDNVCTALSLIGYEREVEAAMNYVFGAAFVAKDMNSAKKVTFDDRIQRKSVTLGGDSFDPAGTLTGGARAQTSSVLEKIQELNATDRELREKRSQLAAVEQELQSIRAVAQRFTKLKQQYDLKQQEVQHLKDSLEQGSHHQQLEDVNSLRESIVDYEEIQKKTEDVKKKSAAKVKELENKIKNQKQLREKELKDAEQGVTQAKKKMEESSKKMKEQYQEVDSVKLEVEELKKEVTSYEEQLATVEETLKQYQQQLEELNVKMKEAKDVVKVSLDEVNKQKNLLKACDRDIGARVSEHKTLQKENHSTEIKIKELENKTSKSQKDSTDAAKQVENMLSQYDWIVEEKKYFGHSNTAYDFKANDPKECERRIQKLQDTKDKLSKSVNLRAMNMLGKAEEQYTDLLKKRKIVLNDKTKIGAVIIELDQKKNEALKKAWEQVNKDFGSIYSTLLPGAKAKLTPPEGKSVLEGLEVKVGFGDVWKESLTELSGGQRSLIALSLILAMLLFKPAPIYILDEVDAALDISHTQNIGQMIKSHFKHSQFVVVSLKDGMFNNANVLYKTKFVDGVSTVTRYIRKCERAHCRGRLSDALCTETYRATIPDHESQQEERLDAERRTLTQACSKLQEKLETLEARYPNLQFEYRDPEKNFDRRKVNGLVCKLIKVNDVKAATALEVTAGGKLYNVVVDTEKTGKQLMQKGELRRRYTIIPLNKISSRPITADVAKRAQGLVGPDNVCTALSLIGYEREVEAAMNYVFGAAFVAKDMNSAKKVTFDDRIQRKSVTLGGDSFDPAGTLTGGARAQTSSVLEKIQELNATDRELREKRSQLAAVEQELQSIRAVAQRFTKLKQQYDLKQQEVQHLKDSLEQGSHHQQLEDVNSLRESIVDYEEIQKKTEDVKKKSAAKVKELENKIKNQKQLREKELKDAEQGVTQAKKKMEESSKKMKEQYQEVDSVKLEVEELKKEVTSYEEQLATVEETLKQYQQQLEELNVKMKEAKDVVKVSLDEVNKQKNLLKACDRDIGARVSEHKTLQKENHSTEIKIKELENKTSKSQKDSTDAAKQVENMLSQYDWIVEEKKYFGHSNTAYDFKANDPKECERRIQKLQDTKDKLSKSVNLRAMNMLGKAEEQYTDLLKKRKIVLNDKTKIGAVIIELDQKKNEALKKAWEQVNKDFGSIYSTLLPGAKAKLTPPEGKSVLEGLEVKVGFGDVWKESLTELSGGQRSLIALSLILAMLLFKPAPIYILDEVDAALDISHTQNIGQMIKSHFKHSQFVVVSLKDGMFNNANVLYKTKFVDGVSTVTRYVQNAGRSKESKENHNEQAKKKTQASSKRARVEIDD